MNLQINGRSASRTPARKIGPARRSVTGRVVIRGRSIAFESSLERDFALLMDFDRNVVGVKSQPIRISYRSPEGRRRFYVPDFLVERVSGPPLLCEVKYREDLRRDWTTLRPRLRAAVGYAMRNGMRFSIMTDVEIRGPHLDNVVFLRRFRGRVPDEPLEAHLMRTIAALGETTPQALLVAAYGTEERRMRAVAPLWRLLAERRIEANLFEPLTMASPIWIAVGEL